MLTLIKVTELVCGVAFVTGLFVPLAAILIAPVTINIFLFHLLVDTSGLPVAMFLVFANALIGYAHWHLYRP